MITIIERKIVGPGGRFELSSPELQEGTEIEIEAVVYTGSEMDTTEYLLSSEANKEHLLGAIRDVKEHPEKLIPFDIDEYEKNLGSS